MAAQIRSHSDRGGAEPPRASRRWSTSVAALDPPHPRRAIGTLHSHRHGAATRLRVGGVAVSIFRDVVVEPMAAALPAVGPVLADRLARALIVLPIEIRRCGRRRGRE